MNAWDTNITELASTVPHIAQALRESGGGCLTVSAARNGMPTAQHQGRWLHSAYDPIREAEAWAAEQVAACRPGEIPVLLGVGLLYHAEALQRRLGPDRRLVILVPDLRELHDACSARPFVELLAHSHWVTGSPEEAAKELAVLGHPLRLVAYAPAKGLHETYFATLEDHLRRGLAARAGGQLHVAVVGPIYGGSLPIAGYVVRALHELGHKTRWIDHSMHVRSYEALAGLTDQRNRQVLQGRFADVLSQFTLAQLAEDPPDVVLALAQAPLTSVVLEHLRKKKFLCAMWFVENYRHLTYWQQLAASYDYWFVIQQEACRDALRHAGARDVLYVPMAADPAIHRPMELTPAEHNEFGSDLSFVGAGYANRRAFLPTLLSPEVSFKIWGNEWEGAEALRGVLQRSGARIDTETCMKVFNASRINLNLHSWAGIGMDPHGDFVNPRTFELAACGAFQLVDERSLLPDLFQRDEVVSFRDGKDLPGLIRRWLKDHEGRAAIAGAARRRVLSEHTYVHRVKEILAHIGVRQPDRIGPILNGHRQAGTLAAQCQDLPVLRSLLADFPPQQRVELKDVAARIRSKAATATLSREELLLLMLNEYRTEMRDML